MCHDRTAFVTFNLICCGCDEECALLIFREHDEECAYDWDSIGGAIQVLCNAVGGGRVSDFPEKKALGRHTVQRY